MAEWKQQVLQFWNKINKRQRYTIVGVAVLALVSILGWSYWWSGKPDLVPLYTGLEAKDAGEVAAKLKEMKVSFEPRETPDGTAIFVQSKDVHNVRLDLANIGLPRGKKGFEIFENSKLGTTEFQNTMNYLQALQGELARTIEKIDGVKEVRVHIVLPEDSLYKKNEKPATASVMLLFDPDVQLTKPQIKGIVNLVAHSIKGLQAENITILDQQGKILNDPEEEEDEKQDIGKKTLTQLDMTRKVQDRLQKNVQTLLDQALGEGKAFVRVSVELDFDQRMTDRQLYAPVVDESGIIRSSQEMAESYSGTNAPPPGGPAGTASNIPGYVSTNNAGEAQYDKKEVTRNYEINETKEKVVASPGAIKRLTIAVLVDNNDEQLGQTQRDSISRAVASAVGFDGNRGDTISVEPLPFSTELAERRAQAAEEQKTQEQYKLWLAIGAVVLVLAAIGAFFYLRRRKRLALLAQQEQEAQEQKTLLEAFSLQHGEEQAAVGEEGSKLSPEEEKRITERESIEELIRTKPEEVAQLLRTWLSDE